MSIFSHHQSRSPQRHRRRVTVGVALAIAGTWLAPTFAASSDTWDRLAQCESGQRWNANTGNGYYGGLQFAPGTWRAYGGAEFATKAHQATRAQQITVAERLLADRGWGPWPACAAKLALTGKDARGNPFPATTPADQTATGTPPAAALAAAQKKVTNTAARLVKKQAAADTAQYKVERAIRKARLHPDEWDVRGPRIRQLQAAATRAAQKADTARADAERAARKLRALRAAAVDTAPITGNPVTGNIAEKEVTAAALAAAQRKATNTAARLVKKQLAATLAVQKADKARADAERAARKLRDLRAAAADQGRR